MSKIKAVEYVSNYIKEGALHSFDSLDDSTKEKLIVAFGDDFKTLVNIRVLGV